MTKFIVHTGTGTIIDASECVIIDTEDFSGSFTDTLTGDEYFDDGTVCEYAEEHGKPVNTSLSADTNYGNIISFSPSTLREEARVLLGLKKYEHDKEITDALSYLCEVATDTELQSIGSYILSDDKLWGEYNPALISGALWGKDYYKEEK